MDIDEYIKQSREDLEAGIYDGEVEVFWMLDQLQAENTQLKEQVRWIPVSERLPKLFDIPHPHSEDVLVSGVETIEKLIGWFEKERGWRYGDGTIEIFPTCWKPIVLPDQEEK